MALPSFAPRIALAGIQMTVFAVFLVSYYGPNGLLADLSFWIAIGGTALTFYSLRE